jgi:hypothetical protein
MVTLSDDEARDLVKTILEVIERPRREHRHGFRGRSKPPTGATCFAIV